MHPVEALRWAAPSVITVGALASGLTALRLASSGDFRTSVICIFFSSLLDGLDGHVARALGTSSDFGFELDSLCDLANFGVVPCFVVYFWANSLPSETTGVSPHLLWAACCMYCACCALRLARFNVQGHAQQMNQQHLKQTGATPTAPIAYVKHNILQRKLFFQGIPAPMGAMYALLPLTLSLSDLPYFGQRGTVGMLIVTGVLMVCSLPTFSSKMAKRNAKDSHLRSRRDGVAKLVCGVLAFGSFLSFPFEMFIILVLIHMLTIPVAVVVYYAYATDDSPLIVGKTKN